MGLLRRFPGVFFEPRRTFVSLAERPVWIDALILVLVALIGFSLAVAPYMQQDNLKLIKDSASLKDSLGEDAYNKLIDQTEHPSRMSQIVRTFVQTPLFYLAALLVQSLILLILGRLLSTQGIYVQVLAALIHASFIDKVLGNAVRVVLALARKSYMQTSTGLALLFPKLEVTSTAYIMLTQVDLFQLWMFGVLAFGLSAIFKMPLKKALLLSYGMWLLKALTNILIGVIMMSFLR